MAVLELLQSYVDAIVSHALEEDPNECCGILAGKDGRVVRLYRMTNTEHSSYRFNMDSKELLKTYREIEDSGWELMAIYHSHTHSEAYPSATDIRLATWPEAYYLILSLRDKAHPIIRAFRIADGRVTEEPLQVNQR